MMNLPREILRSDEEAVYRLRALYSKYGYTRYKVSKFEKYDLYAHNKSFLVCENILTFTDTNGQLMALKPDVTLSIVKNFGMGKTETSKLYYSETVYRTSARSEGFREIRQTGLECIGRVDPYLTSEVVMLASQSLAVMSDRYILDVSHMGYLLGLLSEYGVSERDTDEVLHLIANKNLPGLQSFSLEHELAGEALEALTGITTLYEPLETALPRLSSYVRGKEMRAAYEELRALSSVLSVWEVDSPVYADFSIAADRNYYNGIVFRGYVDGIPEAILSGGRYDCLLARMGHPSEAIGFAVYPELIGSLKKDAASYDVDAVLLYSEDTDSADLIRGVKALEKTGKTVRAECGETTSARVREIYRMSGREVIPV